VITDERHREWFRLSVWMKMTEDEAGRVASAGADTIDTPIVRAMERVREECAVPQLCIANLYLGRWRDDAVSIYDAPPLPDSPILVLGSDSASIRPPL
jgi:hypothetical protein